MQPKTQSRNIMPSPGGSNVNNSAILGRIDSLKDDILDIGQGLKDISIILVDLRLTYTGGHVQVVADTVAHKAQLIDHEARIKVLEQVLSDFKTIKAIAIYVAVLLSGFVATLIWEIITHKITIGY